MSKRSRAQGGSRQTSSVSNADRGTASSGPPTRGQTNRRFIAFAVLAIACVLGSAAYISSVAAGRRVPIAAAPVQSVQPASSELPGSSAVTGSASPSIGSGAQPELIFQSVTRGDTYAQVASVALSDPGGDRSFTGLVCERVYYAAGQGLCLVPENGFVSTFYAYIYGKDFVPRTRIELAGPVSRARVSPDGRYGAATVFVFGHSYADANFSTQTLLIDMAAGKSIGDLEDFAVFKDDVRITSPDVNFWGVTFADTGDDFYATLRTGGKTFLVRGNVATREMRVIHEGVECPSLSPDGKRIAFKKRFDEGMITSWRPYVLELATMAETPLAEERSIDDQIEWLDDRTVLYGHEGNIWSVPADGSGAAQLFLKEALSPAVLR